MHLSPTPIDVALADSHRLMLDALKFAVEKTGEVRVVGLATSGDELLRQILTLKPRIAVLNVSHFGMEAFALTAELRRRLSDTRILLLADHPSEPWVEQARRLEADIAFKACSVGQLLDAICAVARGESWRLSGGGAPLGENAPKRLRFDQPHHSPLTARQVEVLRHLARGQSVKEVARLMDLSSKSVEGHKYRIMQILNIHDRVELSLYAIRAGLVEV